MAFEDLTKKIDAKSIIGLITIVTSVISASFFVDDRYAHAGEVTKQMTVITDQLEINRLSSEISVLQIRKSSLEDKIYDGAVRSQNIKNRNVNSPEEVIQNRYRSELDEINRQITNKTKLIDNLKTRSLLEKNR